MRFFKYCTHILLRDSSCWKRINFDLSRFEFNCGFHTSVSNSSQSSSPTIYSLSSGHGKAGVAVIRISGPNASAVLSSMAQFKEIPKERTVTFRRLVDPNSKEMLDKGIVLWFRGPASFTGEDCCELHVHGGLAVISAVLGSLAKLDGFRQAISGEFTRRAFMNGKLDLTAVEGIADLIHAETEAQRKQALRQADGELHKLYFSWRNRILKALAYVEAYIDFSEDENIEDGVLEKVDEEVKKLLMEINNHLSDERRGERLRNGVNIVIVGSPNSGKSSLLNLICRRPAAIVSSIAGTTRDIVECAVNIGGYPILISDTAGLRESQDLIEKEGIKRALERAQHADLVIVMMDSTNISVCQHLKSNSLNDITNQLKSYAAELGLQDILNNPVATKRDTNTDNVMVIVNKTDLIENKMESIKFHSDVFDVASLSCTSMQGVDKFLEKLTVKVENLCANVNTEMPHLTQTRHRQHLVQCVAHLENYLHQINGDIVLAAYELRRCTRQLGKISGDVTTEDVLDVIFREFCIGK